MSKPTTNKNQQPKHVLNVSPKMMDSTNARRKVKPSFDMGVNEKRAEQLYRQGGTPIE